MGQMAKSGIPGVFSIGEVLGPGFDQGSRQGRDVSPAPGEAVKREVGEYRARTPTRSERLNRALAELGLSAFKVHTLLWQWRGAPARGMLSFFTIHSLAKFCNMSRPTVRVALDELTKKGYIARKKYNGHHKNSLYQLVGVRKIPAPPGVVVQRRGRRAIEEQDRGRPGTKS